MAKQVLILDSQEAVVLATLFFKSVHRGWLYDYSPSAPQLKHKMKDLLAQALNEISNEPETVAD